MQRYMLAIVYATFKQRPYLFYKITLVCERFCSPCCDTLLHVAVSCGDCEWKILFPRGISSYR